MSFWFAVALAHRVRLMKWNAVPTVVPPNTCLQTIPIPFLPPHIQQTAKSLLHRLVGNHLMAWQICMEKYYQDDLGIYH